MKLGDRIKNYCNKCHNNTWHTVLFIESQNYGDEEFRWYTNYSVLKCAGCDNVCFRTDYTDSESYEPNEYGNWVQNITTEVFPASNEGLGNIEHSYEIPTPIRAIYSETLQSISAGCYTLAGIGLRATIEALCNHENIEGRNLEIKISRLISNGLISKDDGKKLHAIRFLGNDAAHDTKIPNRDQVIIALKIIQHLLSSKYAMQDEIDKFLELPISDYEEFKNLLNKKIIKLNPGATFTLQYLIGKDKRRFTHEDYLNFLGRYESEIEQGAISTIENISTEIKADYTVVDDSSPITPSAQTIYRKKIIDSSSTSNFSNW